MDGYSWQNSVFDQPMVFKNHKEKIIWIKSKWSRLGESVVVKSWDKDRVIKMQPTIGFYNSITLNHLKRFLQANE